MSHLWCIQVNNQNVTNLFILLLLIYQKKSPNEVFSFLFIKVIHYTQNHSDSLTVDLIWRLLSLQIKFSYNHVYFNFTIWEMRNYKSVLLDNISVFCDLLPVHTSCYWSAYYLLPLCSTLWFSGKATEEVCCTNTMTVNLTKCLNLCCIWGEGLHSGVLDMMQEWQKIVGGSSCLEVSVDRTIKD